MQPRLETYKPRRRLRQRTAVLLIVAVMTFLAGGVAVAQSSYYFDLACRSLFTAAGGTAASVNVEIAVTGALGVPAVGTTAAATFAVRSGFLPGYPNNVVAAAQAQPAQITPALNQDDPPVILRLPLLENVTRIVRGGC
jgi:hypothetical protein